MGRCDTGICFNWPEQYLAVVFLIDDTEGGMQRLINIFTVDNDKMWNFKYGLEIHERNFLGCIIGWVGQQSDIIQ